MGVSARGRSSIMRLRLSKAAAILFGCTCLCVPALAFGLHLGIRWDPNYPTKEIAGIWSVYLEGRIRYRVQNKMIIPKVGVIEPVFDEEVFGRDLATQTYADARRKDPKVRDAYWDDMVAVRAAAFMREYVWTYLKRPSWPETQKPSKISAFQNWQRQHLKNHRSQTHGAVIGEN